MTTDDTPLLDCGHYSPPAGICQYEGCADTMCEECVAACEACGRVLCPPHQLQLENQTRVFCRDHGPVHVGKKLLKRIIK